MTNDPLLQPYQLKHLTLKNRIMITSHEPAYPEDGMPKERYRAYHEERAKAGVALTMTAGSAAVSRDSPPVFNNILAYKDEVVPWMKQLTDACHEHDCAVMIQLTHLGRRTSWNKGDWLPVVSLDLETYVASVVGAEMPSSWHGEALRRKPLQPAPMRWPISPDRQRRRITWGIQPVGRYLQGSKAPPQPVLQQNGKPAGSS